MLTTELNETVLALPAVERIELARRLVESVVWPASVNGAVAEGIRRIEDVAAGRTAGLNELALALYAGRRLTIIQAADLAGSGLFEFQALLRDHGIPQHNDAAELDQDLLALRELPR